MNTFDLGAGKPLGVCREWCRVSWWLIRVAPILPLTDIPLPVASADAQIYAPEVTDGPVASDGSADFLLQGVEKR